MEKLVNPIQRYAWGSLTEIPRLLGVKADGTPQAELWLGSHPAAPSSTRSGTQLDALISAAPERLLGTKVVQSFGPHLPFLLKVLAAAEPLSLQAHPNKAQAIAGFQREELAGVARGAFNRNYKDANHKPEIICALTPFRALCGFRSLAESLRFFTALGLDVRLLKTEGLRSYFEFVMSLPKPSQNLLVNQVLNSIQTNVVPGFEAECALALQLHHKYPHDIGIVGALLLNLVWLQPGQALYLGAGNLHAYLEGTGIELMANSDNVLRGGLTPKHIDVAELLSVLDFTDGPPNILQGQGSPEAVYFSPASDFRLSRIDLQGELSLGGGLPQILLVTTGSCTSGGQTFETGESMFGGADEVIELAGEATLFRATPGL